MRGQFGTRYLNIIILAIVFVIVIYFILKNVLGVVLG